MTLVTARSTALLLAVGLLLAACGGTVATPTHDSSPTPAASFSESAGPTPSTSPPGVQPAPGSDSAIYPPNPRAIVVAIDAGHGGCLDWGVPDPSERGVELAEKTLTLDIARRLAGMLEAEGIGVVMIRDEDEALAGDDYPPLGCDGPPWRDVNGDGVAGFGSDLPEGTRTRDELQARLDLANLARADALVSIHINSPTEGGQTVEIAFSETFYTDETPWGPTETARLAEAVQAGVVDRLEALAGYERGDRGITAHNFYLVAPPLLEPTEERPNPFAQPTRGGLMPVVLAEVGSITLREEHDLLASEGGQAAVASGLADGLAAFFAERTLAGRITLAGDDVPSVPEPVDGDGPPFWAPELADGPLRLTIINTGSEGWDPGATLVAGWEASDEPYLRLPPQSLEPVGDPLPALAPGDSVTVDVELPPAPNERSLAWISLQTGASNLADSGSPALQLATGAP